jgi:transcriptional regulator with XRE-family HTH domain
MSNNNDLSTNFAKTLNYYIATSGKTKKEIADAIGVPPTTFSAWSKGRHLPDMDRLQTLANYLQAPVAQFFDFAEVTEKPDPLLSEMMELYPQLCNEDKHMIRSLTVRMLKLYKE